MAEIDIIKQQAKESLAYETASGKEGSCLWLRAERLARTASYISQLSELAESDILIDRFCLSAAAYFCDTGFEKYALANSLSIIEVIAEIPNNDIKDYSAKVVAQKLDGKVTEQKVQRIAKIITESGNRFTNMTEAMILADAQSLDDMGTVGIFNELRRCTIQGKGCQDFIKGWNRKIQYQYWDARINEGFRFDSVKQIAQQRLESAETFMAQLADENEAQDLETLVIATK